MISLLGKNDHEPSNYNPRPIRKRKRVQNPDSGMKLFSHSRIKFSFHIPLYSSSILLMSKLFHMLYLNLLVDSQTIRIGDDDSFDEGDYSDGNNGSDFNLSDEQNDQHNNDNTSGHLNYSQASKEIETLQQQQRQTQRSCSQIGESSQRQQTSRCNEINWDDFINNPEYEQLGIDVQVREDERNQQRSGIQLTAPPEEVRHRPRQPKRTPRSNQIDITADLRAKQMELVDVQLNVQKLLLETAKIAQYEANERLATAKALRKCAELDLASKMSEQNE